MTLVMLDLSVYEFLNILVRKLGRDSKAAATDVSHLFDLDLPIVAIDRDLAIAAAQFAAQSGLSGYDAAFVAGARSMNIPLITADRRLFQKASANDILPLASLVPDQ